MTKDELCKILDGAEYPLIMAHDLKVEAKQSMLTAVYGASDGLMEFEGAIRDEIDCYDGGTAYLDTSGLVKNECDNNDCPYFKRVKESAITITAIWCPDQKISWAYKTDIPHSTFDIMEEGEVYCRGIVFSMEDMVSTYLKKG